MDWLDLGIVLAFVTTAVLLAVYVTSYLSSRRERANCPNCGTTLVDPDEACPFCQEPAAAPAELPPDPPKVPAQNRPVDPRVGHLNPGVTPRMVRGATVIMLAGLGTRFVGMLEPVGVNVQIPYAVAVVLTVLGGLAAFVGFVVLDSA